MKNSSLNNFFVKPFFVNQRLLLVIWLLVAIVGVVSKYSLGTYNNYSIYAGTFYHYIQSLPLYGLYPSEYFDMNHYGILFAFIIAPFALMPDLWGLLLWMLCGTMFLFYAIRALPIERKWQSVIMWLSLNELFTGISYQQFNIATAALILFTFACIERRRESWAAMLILIGTFVKIYGIISLAFFFFVKSKFRFIGYFIMWAVVFLALPMIFTDHVYVFEQYSLWWQDITAKNSANMFAIYQNISLLGVCRKISGCATYSDLWIIGSGVLLFMLSYLRIKQYRNLDFRMMMLASILIFIPIFSTGSESCSYILGTVGVGIWWSVTPCGRSKAAWILLILVIFASFAGNLLPRDIYVDYFHRYALKALPFTFVWLRITYEMLFCDFKNNQAFSSDKKEVAEFNQTLRLCDVDVVLPCYNPTDNWVTIVREQFRELQDLCPNHHFNLIVSNDGSHINFDNEHTEELKQIDGVTIVDNKVNMGKGAALRSGVLTAKSPIVIYTDIDFPYESKCIRDLIVELESGQYDIVLAKRNETYHRELSVVRRFLSFASRTLNKKILGMKYADAQGGLKGFNRVGREIFLQTTIERFLFDTEFIYKASCRSDIRMNQITADLRENIILPEMGLKVIRREFMNFMKILFNR